jgi:23S rRNA (pseudouridine1915-N3)-methyltransferase
MLKLIAIDKIKEKSTKLLIEKYLTRLSNIEIVEVSPEKYHKYNAIETALINESERIAKHLPHKSLIVALDETGVQYSSKEFHKFIYNTLNTNNITFIIGGAYGLSNKTLQNADNIISLSQMTLTHEMARLFLIEQLYRAYTLEKNIKYHH